MNRDTASARRNTPRPAIARIAWWAAATLLGVITWRVLAAGAGSLDWDMFFGDLIRASRGDFLTGLMLTAHAVHGAVIAGSILLLLLLYALRGQWGLMPLLLATVPGGMLLNLGVKLLVHRPRPLLRAAVGSHGYAFPSGHAVAITLLSAYLMFETFRRTTNLSWRVAASIIGVAAVSIVALSRVYLGVHQPSDVAAAILLGVVWTGLCVWLNDVLGARQAARRSLGGVSGVALPSGSSTTR